MTCYSTLANGRGRNMLKRGADMIAQVMIKYKPRRKKRKKGLVKTCKHMYNDVHDTCGAVFLLHTFATFRLIKLRSFTIFKCIFPLFERHTYFCLTFLFT